MHAKWHDFVQFVKKIPLNKKCMLCRGEMPSTAQRHLVTTAVSA